MNRILFTISLFCIIYTVNSQTRTVGLIQSDTNSAYDGYVLFAPMASTQTYLIDKCGAKVHSWSSTHYPGLSVYLLPDGTLLRTGTANSLIFNGGGSGGIIQKIDWNNNITWSYQISDANKCQHHDIASLPNGNILVIAWEKKTKLQAIAAGRDPSNVGNVLWSEQILELMPTGTNTATVVWQWHLWDHLVQDFDSTKANYGNVSANPQLLNINFSISGDADWIHLNSIDYNEDLDQIMVTSHSLSEIWIIDHSTTAAGAAGHSTGNSGKGGDFLYRWGNPAAYDQGTAQDKKLYFPHHAHWIENGLKYENEIMIFNNGVGRPAGNYSSVDIISPPVDHSGNYLYTHPFQPDSAFWSYHDPVPANFYANFISGAQQIKDGHVMISSGNHGKFFEIDSNKNTVWQYINPVTVNGIVYQGTVVNISENNVFRCVYYPPDYSGFTGRNLTANQPIELNPLPPLCTMNPITDVSEVIDPAKEMIHVYPDPASKTININRPELTLKPGKVIIFNSFGQIMYSGFIDGLKKEINIEDFPAGLYIIKSENNFARFIKI